MTTVRRTELAEVNISVVEETLTDDSHVYNVQIACIDSPVIELACVSDKYADALFEQLEQCVDIREL